MRSRCYEKAIFCNQRPHFCNTRRRSVTAHRRGMSFSRWLPHCRNDHATCAIRGPWRKDLFDFAAVCLGHGVHRMLRRPLTLPGYDAAGGRLVMLGPRTHHGHDAAVELTRHTRSDDVKSLLSSNAKETRADQTSGIEARLYEVDSRW